MLAIETSNAETAESIIGLFSPSFPDLEHGWASSVRCDIWREAMASNAGIFFAGVGTTFVILAVGFGGGLVLAKTSLEPSGPSRSVADRLPPARVILPASAEAATPPQPPMEAATAPEPPQLLVPSKEVQQAAEKEKQASERIERRKAEAEERARRKKYAERKARREAARLALQQQEQQPLRSQVGIVALGRDDGQSRWGGGAFGN